jgi:GNAT superfamily N-acetyltransferase
VNEPAGFRTRIALPDEQELVLAVRREAYAGLAPPDQLAALITDDEDGAPNARSYLLVAPDGRPAGTIRASVSSVEFGWPTLRLSKLYPREMEKLLPAGEPVVQSARFGIVPAFRGLRLSPWLLRAVYGAGIAFGADRLVSFVSARPTKLRSWNRIGWRTASEPIAYPLDPHGAVLVVGSIAEILQIARQSDEHLAMAEFAGPLEGTRRFPEEV